MAEDRQREFLDWMHKVHGARPWPPFATPYSYLPGRMRQRMDPPRLAMPEPALHQTALVYPNDGAGGNHDLHVMGPRVYYDVELCETHGWGPGMMGFRSPSREAKGLEVFNASRKHCHTGSTAVLWSGWVTGDEPVVLGGDGSPGRSALWRWWDGKLRRFWHWYFRHVTLPRMRRANRKLA